MDLYDTVFFILSGFLIFFAAFTVSSKKLVHWILFLFLFLLVVAGMFIYFNAVFLGIAELIIYNGGIVLLLAIGISLMPEESLNRSDLKYLSIIPILTLAIAAYLALFYTKSQLVQQVSYSGFGIFLFQNYSILIAVLAITAVSTLISTLYLINKEDAL
ncbi:NADH-quinone oxidoreductase subunit J [Candidatus Parvarchaeota archaeon]|nr:NADH-quinone oxidoreductase subunit J [Candidatus Parvarchaeota archaeon]